MQLKNVATKGRRARSFLKSSDVQPAGPGAFFAARPICALLTSEEVKARKPSAFVSCTRKRGWACWVRRTSLRRQRPGELAGGGDHPHPANQRNPAWGHLGETQRSWPAHGTFISSASGSARGTRNARGLHPAFLAKYLRKALVSEDLTDYL